MKILFSLLIFISLLVSCVSPAGPLGTTTTTATPTVGKVVLTPATGLSGRSVAGNMLATEALSARSVARALGSGSTFSLGDIPSTSSFYFIVQNTGGTPVTNLTFSIGAGPKASDGVTYLEQVTPGVIGTLDPVGTAGVLQIVKVTVIHGQTANLLANAEPSPQGPQSLTVHMAYTDSTGTAQTSDVVMSYNVQSWALTVGTTDMTTLATASYTPAQYSTLQDSYTDSGKVGFAVRPAYSLSAVSGGSIGYPGTLPYTSLHDVGVSLTNTGNVAVTLSGTLVYECDPFSGKPTVTFPFTLPLAAGQTMSSASIAAWFNTVIKNTAAIGGSGYPGVRTLFQTVWSTSISQMSGNVPGKISFDVDSAGAVPGVANVYQKNAIGHYSFDLTL